MLWSVIQTQVASAKRTLRSNEESSVMLNVTEKSLVMAVGVIFIGNVAHVTKSIPLKKVHHYRMTGISVLSVVLRKLMK